MAGSAQRVHFWIYASHDQGLIIIIAMTGIMKMNHVILTVSSTNLPQH